MKKLEELGISPTPWMRMGERIFNKHCYVIAIVDSSEATESPTARLIAAAPKMYKALYDAIGDCLNCTADCSGCLNSKASWIKNAKAALAEASGESEVAK